jgi:hypothetical protein
MRLVKLRAYQPKLGTVVGVDNDGFWIKSPELVAELHKVDQPPKPKEAVVFIPPHCSTGLGEGHFGNRESTGFRAIACCLSLI